MLGGMAEDTPEETEFIRTLLARGCVTESQVAECRRVRQVMRDGLGLKARIWDVIRLKGLADESVVEEIRDSRREERLGPYRLLSKLGEGGMGVVYLAERAGDATRVAVKVLSPRLAEDSEAVRRFEHEARAALSVRHRNLVRGIEFSRLDGQWAFVMEYVEGTTLSRLIRERGALDEVTALEIALQVGLALGAIHERRLVHRDVKPENIMVRPGEEPALLMDLGLARGVGENWTRLTMTGHALGTPSYAAPEQIEGSRVDIRADIYSLGATLYHMVTGVVPFKGLTPAEVLNKQLKHRLAHPRDIRPELTPRICKVIGAMLARTREDRYPDPGIMTTDLLLILTGEEPRSTLGAGERSMVRDRPQRALERVRQQVREAVVDRLMKEYKFQDPRVIEFLREKRGKAGGGSDQPSLTWAPSGKSPSRSRTFGSIS
jgi:serine/threonine-protein kinase